MSDESIFLASVTSQMDRAKAIMEKKEKGLPEEARRLYMESCNSLKEALKKEPNSLPLLLLEARGFFERAKAIRESKLEDNSLYDKYLSKAQKKVEKASKLKELDENVLLLWAKIFIHIAEYTTSLKENELYMVLASEKLLMATELQQPHKDVYKLLERASEVLVNGSKERLREGKAIYCIAGEFTKQGGGRKSLNWKARWFVVTDTTISYFKDKKSWETGPVQGQPSVPQGSIEFYEVTDVVAHSEAQRASEKRPKALEKSHCLHVVTPDRTYNIIGFETQELARKWLETIQFAVKCYNVKRKTKKWLRETSYSSLRGPDTDEEEEGEE